MPRIGCTFLSHRSASKSTILKGELGIEFFERQRKGVALTPAGKSLLIDARRILEDCETSIRKAQPDQPRRDWGIGDWLYICDDARFFG
jgi:hypothetical protein